MHSRKHMLDVKGEPTSRRSAAFAIALTLLLSFSAFMAGLSITSAAGTTSVRWTVYYEYPVIGLNQVERIGLAPTPTTLLSTAPYNVRGSELDNASVIFTRPNGSNVTVNGPFRVDWVRRVNIFVDFAPDQLGNWTFQFNWPGDDKYAASSASGQFTVQQAQVPKRDTTASLWFRPNPIGKGQKLLVNAWVTPRPILPGDWYEGLICVFTKPDGSTETVGPMKSYGEGTIWFEYTPTQVGKYSVQFSWPGGIFENGASTQKQDLTVQDQAVPSWPDAALPTQPWSYPVNPENRDWASLIGPYLVPTGGSGLGYDCTGQRFNPYTQAPRTAHVNWMIPQITGVGGLVGGQYGQIYTYANGMPSIDVVLAGKAFYQFGGKIYCVDAHTGKQLWSTPGYYSFGLVEGASSLAQTPELVFIGAPGGITGASGMTMPTAGNLTLVKYDVTTGNKLLDVTIASDPGARYLFIAMDYQYAYVAQAPAGVDENLGPCRLLKIKITGTETTNRVIYNVNYPFSIVDVGITLYGDVLSRISFGVFSQSGAINTTTGQILWNGKLEDVISNTMEAKSEHVTSANGVEFIASSNGRYVALDMKTGQVKWRSQKTDYPWGDFWAYGHSSAYGKIYVLSYAGVYAMDQQSGNITWHYSAGDSGYETPYSTWPYGSTDPVAADGIVFAPTSEHSPAIYYRGQQLHAIDANTGKKVWSIMGYYTVPSIAEGTLFANNAYDGNAYAFAKGATSTTVTVSSKVVAKGSALLIEGTVMDQSPAQPNTPAIADASMSDWMEYLHMQQPKPTNATGVSVTLTAVDSSGKSSTIGATTSDASGNYAFTWKPSTEGTYMVVASFRGSDSYYSSYAETAVSVTAAPSASASPSSSTSPSASAPPTSTPTNPTTSPSETVPTSPTASPTATQAPPPTGQPSMDIYIIAAVVAIIVVISAIALVLRKRK